MTDFCAWLKPNNFVQIARFYMAEFAYQLITKICYKYKYIPVFWYIILIRHRILNNRLLKRLCEIPAHQVATSGFVRRNIQLCCLSQQLYAHLALSFNNQTRSRCSGAISYISALSCDHTWQPGDETWQWWEQIINKFLSQ